MLRGLSESHMKKCLNQMCNCIKHRSTILIYVMPFLVLSVFTLSCDDNNKDPFGDSLPEAPLNLRGGANDRFAQIVWDNPDQEVDGFGIERKTIGEEFRLLNTVDQATTSYTSYFDSTINNHGIYYYRVYSFIQDKISSY